MRVRSLLIGLVVGLASQASAQNSVFGVRGVGFPDRQVSVRARALGGGFGMFDETSSQNPAAVAGFRVLRAGISWGTTFRSYDISGVNSGGMKETRFPHIYVGSGLGQTRFSYSISFSTYLERSFDFTTSGTDVVDGATIAVNDRVVADGSVADIRAAVGFRATNNLHLGLAFHLLNGSSTVDATREFVGSSLSLFEQNSRLTFQGKGVSGGIRWRLRPGLEVAAAARVDTELSTEIDDGLSESSDLPYHLSGGIYIEPLPRLRFAGSAKYSSWSDTDFAAGALTTSFDTYEVGGGAELGSAGASHPLRVGIRYATLPFGGTTDQPTEWMWSVGTALNVAQGRGRIDVTLERFSRSASNASERGWYLTFGATVVPGF